MKKLICSIIMVILMAGNVYAKDLSGRVGLGIGADWFYYLKSEDNFSGDNMDLEGTANTVNFHISYCLPKPSDIVNLSLILDWERIVREIEFEQSDMISNEFGVITMMPLMLGAQLRIANLGPITPYVGFAAGISFNSFFEGDRVREWERLWGKAYPGYNFEGEVTVKDSFVFKIPVGVDIFFNDYIALNLEAKYFYTEPDFKAEATFFNGAYSEVDKDNLDQSSFAFGGGINFYF